MYNNITIIPYYIVVKRGDTRAVRVAIVGEVEQGNENDAVSVKIRRVYNMFFLGGGWCMKDQRFLKRRLPLFL